MLVASLILFLAFADWNALRGPIGRMTSAATDITEWGHADTIGKGLVGPSR